MATTKTAKKKPAAKGRRTRKTTAKKSTKKAPAAKKSNGKGNPVALDEAALKAEEKALQEKYKDQKIVPGSIANIGAAKDVSGNTVETKCRSWNKRTVVIRCQWKGCKETRRIATSDLAQVKFCEEHTLEHRRQRRRELRAAARQAKPKAK